jgi:hypothetical protein
MLRHHGRCATAAILAALTVAQSGCATKFVARPTNPLKSANTAGWDPGELSPATEAHLASISMKLGWKQDPARAIRSLETKAENDTSARRAVIEIALAAGIRAHAKFLTDRGAAGSYLCAAEHAFDARSQGDAEFQDFCRRASRYAVARLASLRAIAAEEGVRLRTVIPGPVRTYRISISSHAPGTVSLDQFEFVVPTDAFQIKNLKQSAFIDGVGTPLAGKFRGVSYRPNEFKTADDLWLPLTATVQFGSRGPSQREAIFSVYDRQNVETVQLGTRREPLAGDFSTPFAVRAYELNKENMLTLGILGFLRGDRFFERTGLYPVGIPQRDKIPVIFVHGLISDPNDWRFLHNALLADPKIRERYQFWAFFYPTSMAVSWSSTLFRRELQRVRDQMNPGGHNPKFNQMILIGHSMGGLISRLQISGSGENVYRQYFTKPVDKLRLASSDRAMMKDMFFFSPNPDISEVIFICVPHQGSELATNWIGRIGRALAKLPITVIKTTSNILTFNADAIAADVSVKPGTSIDSLSPGGKFARTLKQMPMDPRVTKYSIIGNRGKGGPVEKSSDGVVPYWSSHIDGVPETIIPSSHSGLEYPGCAIKVREILTRK